MQIGPYRVLDELARGGQGIVFRAEHPSGRPVALKLLARERALSRRRLETELATLQRLRHPNLVRVVDAGEHHGAPWIAQELVEGESLQERIDRVGAFPVGKAVEVAHTLALALDYAHGCGVLHRDLKPANVMLRPDGTPVLLDFGLARDLEDERSRVTQSGVLMGSPGYWAPELATGQRGVSGVPTDVYGLGALAYAMISGRPPVDPRSLEVATSTECEPLHRVRPDVPRPLSDVVARCLLAEPSTRYPTCAAVARALLAAQEDGARPASPGPRRAWPWALATLALLAVGGGLVYVLVTPADGGGSAAAPDPYVEAFVPIRELILAGDHPRALARVEELLERYPTRAALISLRGELLVRLQRYEEALPYLDRALELDPELPTAWAARGQARGRLGAFDAAYEDVSRSLSLDPRAGEVWMLRGYTQLVQGRVEGALADFERALSLEPGLARAWIGKSRGLLLLRRVDQAREACERAIELEPENPAAYLGRAAANEVAGNAEAMAADMRRALELDPQNATLWHRLSLVDAKFGRFSEALGKLDRALEVDPDHVQANIDRSKYLANRGQLEEALRDLEHAEACDPSPGELQELRELLRSVRARLPR